MSVFKKISHFVNYGKARVSEYRYSRLFNSVSIKTKKCDVGGKINFGPNTNNLVSHVHNSFFDFLLNKI